MASPYLHGWPHSSSRKVTSYHEHWHPGIPSIDTPNPDGTALVVQLPTHGQNHTTTVIAQSCTNANHKGKCNCTGISSMDVLPQAAHLTYMSLLPMHRRTMHSLLPNPSLVSSCSCWGNNYLVWQEFSRVIYPHTSTHSIQKAHNGRTGTTKIQTDEAMSFLGLFTGMWVRGYLPD